MDLIQRNLIFLFSSLHFFFNIAWNPNEYTLIYIL